MDYNNDHTLDDFEHELGTNNFVVVTYSNLSNFSAKCYSWYENFMVCSFWGLTNYGFLNDSWANMGQKEDIVDLSRDTSQPFQPVVPRKKKSKKQQSDASKGFKVGVSSHSPC